MARIKRFIGLWVVLLAFAFIFVSYYFLSTALDDVFDLPQIMPEPDNVFAAAVALVIGVFWVLWAYSYLHFVGRGSPAEAFGVALYPTERLVTTGPYAYTRNPMLLGIFFVLIGIAFLLNSLAGLIAVPVLALVAVAYIKRFEEPALLCRFDKEYARYRQAVPMLIPTRRPYSGSTDKQ